MNFSCTSIAIAATFGFCATAQAQEWEYTGSLYLFAPETTTSIGNRSATLSFSEAVENLGTALMVYFWGRNVQWGLLLDYMLTDISFSSSTPGTAFDGAESSVKTQIFTGYLSYRLYQADTVQTDLLAGMRWFDTDTTLTLLPGTSPGSTVGTSDSWTDPVIGVRSKFDLHGNWSGTFVADYGGSSDRETWQVLVSADYAFNDKWTGRVGYRHIDVSNDERRTRYRFEQSGPVLGIMYKF